MELKFVSGVIQSQKDKYYMVAHTFYFSFLYFVCIYLYENEEGICQEIRNRSMRGEKLLSAENILANAT